ncbi:fimbrial protein [Leclercia adecarboxylata]|uniref:fimbrial protein n=1 Tax=Leclercia adecarboxylata TaxID=83655 RepID=UPI00202A59FD|nr:fimbrial protein [Leclercia adecarboxylata]URN99636.1 fimbrial protein [Leclercia adecarboxylata]
MKKYVLLMFGLLIFSAQSIADCKYSTGTTPGTVGLTLNPRLLSDASLPIGSVLFAKTVGVSSMKTFYNCDITSADPDLYRIDVGSKTPVPGVTGMNGEAVYETGIDGIGFQVSDALSGEPGRPVVAKIGTYPLTVTATMGIKQWTVWLIKTKAIIDTSKSTVPSITITYAAGRSGQVNSLILSTQLLRVTLNLGTVNYRATSCNLTPRGGNVIKLDPIKLPDLKKITPPNATGKAKEVILDMTCPSEAVGINYNYWFNPISGSDTKDGVLLNSTSVAAGGAQDVGFIIKQGSTAVKFYDYDDYQISKTKATQEIKFNIDYYRLSNNISQGAVTGLIEVILQEK